MLRRIKNAIIDIFRGVMKQDNRPKDVIEYYKRAERFEERFDMDNYLHVGVEITAWYDKKTGKVIKYDTCVIHNPNNHLIDLLRTVRGDSGKIDEIFASSIPTHIENPFKHNKIEITPLDISGKTDEEIANLLKERNKDLLND